MKTYYSDLTFGLSLLYVNHLCSFSHITQRKFDEIAAELCICFLKHIEMRIHLFVNFSLTNEHYFSKKNYIFTPKQTHFIFVYLKFIILYHQEDVYCLKMKREKNIYLPHHRYVLYSHCVVHLKVK